MKSPGLTEPADTPARGSARTPGSAPPPQSAAERWLRGLGADPAFVEAVLGDLAEEYACRTTRDGAHAAGLWYAREALRAAPHLAVSAVRHAARHGGPRAYARLAAGGAAAALTLAAVAAALLARDGPPARLVAGAGEAAEGIVVNSTRPVRLPVQVRDAAGHVLRADGLRYRWESGAPMAVSSQGVVGCARRGDATVRVALGGLAASVPVRCRPVREIAASTWISLVAGGRPRPLPFVAVGVDGRPVGQLRGAVRVLDSSVATVAGADVRPRAVGETAVSVEVGDHAARIRVLVHERVRTFAGLRPDQRLVAVPVRLARGDTVRWAVSGGVFWLKYIPGRPGASPPTITVDGQIVCAPGDGLQVYRLPPDEYGTYCVVHPAGARVTVAHGREGAAVVDGSLALERVDRH